MAIRNQPLEQLRRHELKTLEARFLTEITEGLHCSPFEAQAVLQVVEEVFLPHLQDDAIAPALTPGQIALVVVDADEPGGKPLAACARVTVRLTVQRAEDAPLIVKGGLEAFRRARIPDLCQQALSQGGLLTREDLAWSIFYVTPRTITRDLKALREADPDTLLPLRSNKHDIGPVLTHRVRIVELALEGKTFSQIQTLMRHSPSAISNYVSTFTRTVQLHRRGLQPGQIAFLLRRGKGLITKYLDLLTALETPPTDKNRLHHLEELLLCDGRGWSGSSAEKKTSPQPSTPP